MAARRPSTATVAFGAVALLSTVVLFGPGASGEPRFPYDDKVVHLTLFAVLAAVTRWRFGGGGAVLLAVCAYAPGSELVQGGLLPGRSGDPLDVLAYLAGVAVGWSRTGRVLERRALQDR